LRIVLRPQAETELAEAREWYDARVPGLGAEFLTAFDDAIATIRRNPNAAPKVFKSARRMILNRFPYLVIYTNTTDEIVVHACIHGKRHPRRWKSRV
jgi:hypothetical protein